MAWSAEQRQQWTQFIPIPEPVGFIAVRTMLLTLETTRWPIYRLVLAPDFLCELQAQPLEALRFKGHVVIVEDAPTVNLRTGWQSPQFRLKFALRYIPEVPHGRWFWQAAGAHFIRGATWEYLYERWPRVLEPFVLGRFATLKPTMFLRPTCLYCGRTLTDPVSIARLIGPECADSSSLVGVLNFRLREPEPVA